MPLKIDIRIDKRMRGAWLPELKFHMLFEDGEDLKLNPYLSFKKVYTLPGPIFFNTTDRDVIPYNSFISCCRKITCLDVDLGFSVNRPGEIHHTKVLRPGCQWTHDSCRAFLVWQPGQNAYDDYIKVFQQLAQDLVESWNRAVAEAAASQAGEIYTTTVFSDTYLLEKQQEQTTKIKSLRKINVS
jgi:hypothetical protein